ncbi:unnamed protein product [Aphanomyces euteiches]
MSWVVHGRPVLLVMRRQVEPLGVPADWTYTLQSISSQIRNERSAEAHSNHPSSERCVAVGPEFNQDGSDAFYNLDFKQDDIVALTYGKCGTTYLQKIIYLLTRLDDSGNFPPGYDSSADVAAEGQLYLDWMYHESGDRSSFAREETATGRISLTRSTRTGGPIKHRPPSRRALTTKWPNSRICRSHSR